LHEKLPALFREYSVPLLESRQLPELRDQSLVVLGAHGKARNQEGFIRLVDDANEYEPDQVAQRLANTACVVVFVCHGGRGDEALYSHETSGLTSSLLRHGVRAVVASLWPLDAQLAVAWLEEFALTDPKEALAVRVDQAQHKMAQRGQLADKFGEHPLVRSTFTVFGDGLLRIPFPIQHVGE
jgi:CHAT domain-containing protein